MSFRWGSRFTASDIDQGKCDNLHQTIDERNGQLTIRGDERGHIEIHPQSRTIFGKR